MERDWKTEPGKISYEPASQAERLPGILDRIENEATNMVIMAGRLSKILDRIHGPLPEDGSVKDPASESPNVMFQLGKMEEGVRRCFELIDSLEGAV